MAIRRPEKVYNMPILQRKLKSKKLVLAHDMQLLDRNSKGQREAHIMTAYYLDGTGHKIEFHELAIRILNETPHVRGKHISKQLEALGLLDGFQRGETPCGLPFSFTDYECTIY